MTLLISVVQNRYVRYHPILTILYVEEVVQIWASLLFYLIILRNIDVKFRTYLADNLQKSV